MRVDKDYTQLSCCIMNVEDFTKTQIKTIHLAEIILFFNKISKNKNQKRYIYLAKFFYGNTIIKSNKTILIKKQSFIQNNEKYAKSFKELIQKRINSNEKTYLISNTLISFFEFTYQGNLLIDSLNNTFKTIQKYIIQLKMCSSHSQVQAKLTYLKNFMNYVYDTEEFNHLSVYSNFISTKTYTYKEIIDIDFSKLNLTNLSISTEKQIKLNLCVFLYKDYEVKRTGILLKDSSEPIEEHKVFILYFLNIIKENKKKYSSILHLYDICKNFIHWTTIQNKTLNNSLEATLSLLKDFYTNSTKSIQYIYPLCNILNEIYETNVFHSILSDDSYKLLVNNTFTFNELIDLSKKNAFIKKRNLVIKTSTGKKIYFTRILYPDYKAHPKLFFYNENSYCKFNINFANYIYETLILKAMNGDTEVTLKRLFDDHALIIQWAYDNGYSFNNSFQGAKEFFNAFTLYLKQSFRLGKHKKLRANLQHSAFYMLKEVYNDVNNELLNGLTLLSHQEQDEPSTFKSEESEFKYFYNFYYRLFEQISDFLLTSKKYPLELKLPNKNFWCLPLSKQYIEFNSDKSPKAFNSHTGKIKTIEEIHNLNRNSSLKAIKSFEENLVKGNQDNSQFRINLAKKALKSFYILFLANTGLNDSVASQLEWDTKLEKDGKISFSAIKKRASWKKIFNQIQKNFIPTFNIYLKIREFLLQGHSSNYLFFKGHGVNTYHNTDMKLGSFSSIICRTMRNQFDKNLPIITSRTLRENKIEYTYKRHGIIAAQQVSQNSIEVLLTKYINSNESQSEKELDDFFTALNKMLLKNSDRKRNTQIGGCAKEKDEINESKDCTKKEMCLFCIDYRLHPDKEDLQKLFSMKFLINEVRYISNPEQFNNQFGKVINRLDEIEQIILNEKRISVQGLKKIKYDVFENEILHPYWEFKLKILLEMGLLK